MFVDALMADKKLFISFDVLINSLLSRSYAKKEALNYFVFILLTYLYSWVIVPTNTMLITAKNTTNIFHLNTIFYSTLTANFCFYLYYAMDCFNDSDFIITMYY